MAKKMLIDATHPEETRVVVVDGTQVEEFDFETVNKRQLAGNIYLAKVTRVEPSLQAAFVDYGGNRHGFLAFAEIHPDYYQIPAADRHALLEEERAAALAAEAEDDARDRRSRGGSSRSRAESTGTAKALDTAIASEAIPGMELAESDGEDGDDAAAPVTLGGGEDASAAETAEPTEETSGQAARDVADSGDAEPDADGSRDDDEPRDVERQVETASERDDTIESVADEDVASEIAAPRKPRARRYKIQEVIKVRQIMLVQVVKEERGNKGAALTTYLSLAGRYCVLMPNTARGGGISRKITNAADRKKLKEIASELEVPQGAGLIIRTAGSQRTKTEIRRDYEYLMRLWEQIRDLTFRSTAPAPIYEEGDLIKRQIRDLYSKEIDEVLVEGERGYRTARDFMAMIMPSHARNVKRYADPVPLFARYQVEGYLAGMFNPVVQLKSGGYIVIGITEALVAIDVNSGRATKEGSIEETAYKTNCEAADEIARQLRLRDLAGLIVVDFIDMDERKNNANVEKRFKDRLKSDRARIQVGRISGFGLLEMSRQRLHPGMLESTTQPCQHCHGTGLIRSDDSLALSILRAIEEEGTKKRSREVLVKAPVAVANYLINQKREHVALIEARSGMSVRIEADPLLVSPEYAIEKFKTATRIVPEPVSSPALSVDARLMAEIDDETDDLPEEDEAEAPASTPAPGAGLSKSVETDGEEDADETSAENGESAENGDASRSRRRRRRRRRGSGRSDEGEAVAGSEDAADTAPADAAAESAPVEADRADVAVEPTDTATEAPLPAAAADATEGETAHEQDEGGDDVAQPAASGVTVETVATAEATEATMPDRTPPAEVAEEDAPMEADAPVPDAEPGTTGEDATSDTAPAAEAVLELVADRREAETGEAAPEPESGDAEAEPVRPKRRGWWSFGA